MHERLLLVFVQAPGIETVAVVQRKQLLEGNAQASERRFHQNAFEPVGQRLLRLAREAAGGQHFFQPVKSRVVPRPEDRRVRAGPFRGSSPGSTLKDDVIQQHQNHGHESPEDVLLEMGLTPEDFFKLKNQPGTQIRKRVEN